jgi:hypothetical protein
MKRTNEERKRFRSTFPYITADDFRTDSERLREARLEWQAIVAMGKRIERELAEGTYRGPVE